MPDLEPAETLGLVEHQLPDQLHCQVLMRINCHSSLHNVQPIRTEARADSRIARFPVLRVPTCHLPIDDSDL